MQLYYSITSPFARKTLITIIEKGLYDKTEIVALSPVGDGAAQIQKSNPLGKIPVLVNDDGLGIFDSPVICEYLDEIGDAPKLIPQSGSARLEVLQMQALCDGILDAAFNIVMEKRRDNIQQSSVWLERWNSAILRGLSVINSNRLDPNHAFDLGQISLVCALGYLEFRLPEIAFQSDEIIDFWGQIAQRPSVSQTTPKE